LIDVNFKGTEVGKVLKCACAFVQESVVTFEHVAGDKVFGRDHGMDNDLIGGVFFNDFFELLKVKSVLGFVVASVGTVKRAVFAEFDFDKEDLLLAHGVKFISESFIILSGLLILVYAFNG
jgi:hypothetical protein